MIALIGRTLLTLLCTMTAPRETAPAQPTVQLRPGPPSPPGACIVCRTQPQRSGADYCGDACQAIWHDGPSGQRLTRQHLRPRSQGSGAGPHRVWRSTSGRCRMAGMDAATYRRLADQYGACDEERDHELANARWDLQHRPETVHGRDAYAIAADALAAARAHPRRHLEPVEFAPTEDPAWTPGQALAARRR